MEKVQSLDAVNYNDRPLKLLEIIGNASFGGMERYIINFLDGLPPDGFEVTCICPYESPFTRSLRDMGYTVYIMPISDDPVWRSIQFTSEIAHLHQVDVIHAHMPKAHTLGAIAGMINGTPVVASVHGMHFSSYEYGVARQMDSWLITNCQEAYGQVLGLGIPPGKVFMIHNGVDINKFTPEGKLCRFRKKFNLSDGEKLVGFAGRISHEKGPDLFLRIAGYMHRASPGVHFVMAGQGEMMEEIKTMSRQLNLDQVVHFVGWQQDLAAFYRELDLLVYTSRSDGTSLALLEAMACGCPAVAMDVGGVREIIENRHNGLLASPVRWEDSAVMALDLLEDEPLLTHMAAETRPAIVKNFNLEDKITQTANAIQRVHEQSIRRKHNPLEGAPGQSNYPFQNIETKSGKYHGDQL